MKRLTDDKQHKLRRAIICILLALIFTTLISRFASSNIFYQHTIASLDRKKSTVMELSAAAASASAIISLLPDDTMTPIADKMADLTIYFLIILSVIYLEKYLLPVLGYLDFGILIPIFFVLMAINCFKNVNKPLYIVKKIMIIGLVILLAIPVSETVSDIIKNTYSDSMGAIINDATQEVEDADDDEGGITAIISKIKDGVTNVTKKFENTLTNLVEAIAVLIVTDCLIPICVLAFCLWLLKYVSGMLVDVRPIEQHSRHEIEKQENN